MAMNLQNEALSDVRVRQAINYAVDKQALIDTVWWGYGQKIGSHYPTVLKEYVDMNEPIPLRSGKGQRTAVSSGISGRSHARNVSAQELSQHMSAPGRSSLTR